MFFPSLKSFKSSPLNIKIFLRKSTEAQYNKTTQNQENTIPLPTKERKKKNRKYKEIPKIGTTNFNQTETH